MKAIHVYFALVLVWVGIARHTHADWVDVAIISVLPIVVGIQAWWIIRARDISAAKLQSQDQSLGGSVEVANLNLPPR